jgi:translation elongation factor EF-1beta
MKVLIIIMASKKAKKTNALIYVTPADSEIKMDELETQVKAIALDSLEWRAAEFKPTFYGMYEMLINVIYEEGKVNIDELTDAIEKLEDVVGSTRVKSTNIL